MDRGGQEVNPKRTSHSFSEGNKRGEHTGLSGLPGTKKAYCYQLRVCLLAEGMVQRKGLK